MGKKYLFVIYNYAINSILVLPMKVRKYREFLRVLKDLHKHLRSWGIKHSYTTSKMRLDNEASPYLQIELWENNIDFQLIPPGINRHNSAEYIISTLKEKFISVLCSMKPESPIQNWDQLLDKEEVNINFLSPQDSTTWYQHMKNSMGYLITTAPPWIHQEQYLWSTARLTTGEPELHMANKDSIYSWICSTITA